MSTRTAAWKHSHNIANNCHQIALVLSVDIVDMVDIVDIIAIAGFPQVLQFISLKPLSIRALLMTCSKAVASAFPT